MATSRIWGRFLSTIAYDFVTVTVTIVSAELIKISCYTDFSHWWISSVFVTNMIRWFGGWAQTYLSKISKALLGHCYQSIWNFSRLGTWFSGHVIVSKAASMQLLLPDQVTYCASHSTHSVLLLWAYKHCPGHSQPDVQQLFSQWFQIIFRYRLYGIVYTV